MSERRKRRRRATTLCCASFNCTSFLSLFGFISSFKLYRLNVAIYLLYKFVIWFGIFDAMGAEAKEQQLEQEYENETRQSRDRKRDDCKCQYIIFHIFLSLCLLHLKTSSHLRYFIWQKEIQTVINSTKRLQIHRLVLNYANNSNPCISSLIAINSLLSKNKK